MKMYKYSLPILATTLVVGTSAPAWSYSPSKIIRFGQSVSQFFQKSDDAARLLDRKPTKTILTEIGKQSLLNTLSAPIAPPESSKLPDFSSNGQTQDDVRQNIARIVPPAGITIVGGVTASSYLNSNNKDNQNPRSTIQFSKNNQNPRSTIQFSPSLLSKKSIKLR
ncbi:hypothetical protein [Limnofasciculus baicalensis]|uniref:Uncharacterized protein n=1 Tax=Limnofasciculus baicalensis BBK-W-15 TaxID=2699891 RepID=A0AAE3GRG2_9CYAN|nr:hypothetical protein [Limnofasciculus baicalensis]MCP2729355.1 hypothetical protein [Limnofasciculus baicalensis BBK-W-15]